MLPESCRRGRKWRALSLAAGRFSGVVTTRQKSELGPKGGRKGCREGHSTEPFPRSLHHLLNTGIPKHPWRGKKPCQLLVPGNHYNCGVAKVEKPLLPAGHEKRFICKAEAW